MLLYMCPQEFDDSKARALHTTACVLILLVLVCMCFHTTVHVSSGVRRQQGAGGGGEGDPALQAGTQLTCFTRTKVLALLEQKYSRGGALERRRRLAVTRRYSLYLLYSVQKYKNH